MYKDLEKRRLRRRERSRELRNERFTIGLCIKCGLKPFVVGMQVCQTCRDKHYNSANQKQRRLNAKANGMCTSCYHKPAVRGRTKCGSCFDVAVIARTRQRESVYSTYGNKCSCLPCGETRWQFLVLDHVNDDGAKHRLEIGESARLVEWAYKNGCPPSLRLLCANCNTGRERNKGVCPHLG